MSIKVILVLYWICWCRTCLFMNVKFLFVIIFLNTCVLHVHSTSIGENSFNFYGSLQYIWSVSQASLPWIPHTLVAWAGCVCSQLWWDLAPLLFFFLSWPDSHFIHSVNHPHRGALHCTDIPNATFTCWSFQPSCPDCLLPLAELPAAAWPAYPTFA